MKKWSNIRDSFQRSERNFKKSMKSGSAKQPKKTYIYGEQLKFLKKTVTPHDTDDSFPDSGKCAQEQEVSGNSDNENGQVSNNSSDIAESVASGSASFKKPEQQKRNKRKADPVELELLSVIKKKDRHTSFFAGITPSLNTFDDDDVIEFQLKVLQIVSEIKKRKKNDNLTNQNTACLPNPNPNDIISVQGRQYLNLQPRVTPSTSCQNTNLNIDAPTNLNNLNNLNAAQYYERVGSSPNSIYSTEQFSENSLDDYQF